MTALYCFRHEWSGSGSCRQCKRLKAWRTRVGQVNVGPWSIGWQRVRSLQGRWAWRFEIRESDLQRLLRLNRSRAFHTIDWSDIE